ncbi:hypothetical protein QC764_504135 [Podospora pseudoanserina]|uniref:Mid2 domain-containing protein n=1 Tax=Podospora pseudoanserina TaxID=2609844 RepID=A0ABR0I5I7_9PEZI|nr:hypothetical protein QC764_504135 [Podospora pseudoanserina]
MTPADLGTATTTGATTTAPFPFAETTSQRIACSALVTGYYQCGSNESEGCCPTGYACAEEMDRCIIPSTPSTNVDFTGRCFGLLGYGQCDEEAGGGCCPSSYACLDGSCMLTHKVQKTLTSWVSYGSVEAGTTPSIFVMDYSYPPDIQVSLTRLFNAAPMMTTDPFFEGTTTSPLLEGTYTISRLPTGIDTEPKGGLGTGIIVGIVVSCVAVGLMIIAGLFFFVRRQRRNRKGDGDSKGSPAAELAEKSIVELAEKSDVYEADTRRVFEADTERYTHEMACNDIKTEAWELEDTSCKVPGAASILRGSI